MKIGFVEIEIGKLKKASWNYKTEDDLTAKKLENNIGRIGQIENIVVRELSKDKFEIINGNHRLDQFKKLKFKKVMCYNCGKLSLEDASRIAIELNETRFSNDPFKLAERMKEISSKYSIEELALTMPYSEDEIKAMSELLHFDYENYQNATNEGDHTEADKKSLKLELDPKTFKLWERWEKKCNKILGYESKEKCFEFAIVEAMNIPDESLSK